MKKIIVFICVIALAITINGCKCEHIYACCSTGHPEWKGPERKSCQGQDADQYKMQARTEASDHDSKVHGGVKTAGVCDK